MDASVFATGLLNLLAAVGAGVYGVATLRRADRTALETRFAAIAGAMALLTAIRGVDGLSGLNLQRLEDVVAAFAPLGVLVLAEGALRRHAPRVLKLAVLAGTALFALAALLKPDGGEALYGIAFAFYFGIVVLAIGFLLARSGAGELSPAELRVIGGLGLVLVLAAPLALTDFAAVAGHPPIRLGALGVLILAYAAARMSAPEASAGALGRDAGLALGLGAAGGIAALGLFPGATGDDMARVASLMTGAVLAAQTLIMLRDRARQDGPSAWDVLADASLHGDRAVYLRSVLAAPAFEGVRLFDAEALATYEPERLAGLFADRLTVSRSELGTPEPGSVQDVLAALMERASVSHAAAVALAPMTLAVVDAGGLADRRVWSDRLAVLARIARGLPAGAPDATR